MAGITTILGAGLAGLSASYHLGHDRCVVFEQARHAGGHVFSHHRAGCVWDEGPHVSFTRHGYVRDLFAQTVEGGFEEFAVEVGNYFAGTWLPHPAQAHLYAVPEPLRSACLADFLRVREQEPGRVETYADWLRYAFGETFAETFPAVYTYKYWTRAPESLALDWIGERVLMPSVEAVVQGAVHPSDASQHYIQTVRYPRHGGYFSYAHGLLEGARVRYEQEVVRLDLRDRRLWFANGTTHAYDRLVSTLPLPQFVRLAQAPAPVLEAADTLLCTSVLLVNVTAPHPSRTPYHWLYVYDADKLSTRIHSVEKLSPHNAPPGTTGLQVEVYYSAEKPLPGSDAEVAARVCAELREMGLVDTVTSVHTQRVPWANVVFDTARRDAQDAVLGWLETQGLAREADDLDPMTDWDAKPPGDLGPLVLAGRFGQWKYFWTDDCVLRGQYVARCLSGA